MSPDDPLPTPLVKRRRWVPRLIWLVPLAAAAVGISLVLKSWETAGPRITINFQTGEGLQVGKTLIKYRDVAVGRVSGVTLSADHQSVVVTADLVKSVSELVTGDTQFWVVKARVGVGGASGLDTLLSGSYIGMQTGASNVVQHDFVGLESPPPLAHGPKGLQVSLTTAAVGSLATGAPVYFRHFQVGRVIDENLNADGAMRVSLFVDAPYDHFVKSGTRFWNASGVDLSIGAEGLNVRSESVATVLAGGVAFDDGPLDAGVQTANDGRVLYRNEKEAMAPPDGEPHYVRMRFPHALRGLDVGATVEFVGVPIGSVAAVDLGYDPKDHSFPMIVTAKLFPHRMGLAYQALEANGATTNESTMAAFIGSLVSRGFRAQPRSASLLTGKLYLALDFQPHPQPVRFDQSLRPLELPTVPGSSQELESEVSSLVKKLGDLPLDRIANHLDTDLNDLHGTLTGLNGDVLPRAADALGTLHTTLESLGSTLNDGSPLQRNVADTLTDTRATLASLRSLVDYLDRHPDALIRGRRTKPAQQHFQGSAPTAGP